MILNIFLILAGAGLLTTLYKSTRLQNSLTVLGMGLMTTALYASYQGIHHAKFDSYSYPWLTSKFYSVNIDFISDSALYLMVMALLSSALLSMLYMLLKGTERYKLNIFSFALLGVCCLILLSCSQNTIQLLIGVCFVDVLGFCAINNQKIRRRYIYYNLLADMALFMAFAMLWGDCRTNLLLKLAQCHYQSQNWVLWLILLSTLIKCGLFPFQGILLPVAELSEERQNILSFILTPMSGFFLFYKIFPIIPQNVEELSVFKILIWATFAWSTAGILFIRQLARKKIYLNLIFYALSLAVLIENGGEIPLALGMLFLLHIGLNNGLNLTGKHILSMLILSILYVCAFIIIADSLPSLPIILAYMVIVLIAISNIVWSLYDQEERDNNILLRVLVSVAVAGGIIYSQDNIPENFYYWLGIYFALLILNPYRWLRGIYDSPKIQTAQGFSGGFYFLIVQPIEFLGRILLLTIDFLIIEKSILGSLSKINMLLMTIFNKIHQPNRINRLFFIGVGIVLIVYSCYGDW